MKDGVTACSERVGSDVVDYLNLEGELNVPIVGIFGISEADEDKFK